LDRIIAFAGGVGGAKLVYGLTEILNPDNLDIVVNTGDDEEIHGLHVSPDLDTMMYTLSGKSNEVTGWGIKDETFRTLDALNQYGIDTWFKLGDLDFATHIYRTYLIKNKFTLSEITSLLSKSLGLLHQIIPMTDCKVRTIIDTDAGIMTFQEYFVKNQCQPKVNSIIYKGAKESVPSNEFRRALENNNIIIYCPSNPFLSIAPILEISGVTQAIRDFKGLRIAVSPIVNGSALKGPAAKILYELGEEVSAYGVAKQFVGICDYFVIDEIDHSLKNKIETLGIKVFETDIVMQTNEQKVKLAEYLLAVCNFNE
jgi:LPPG:FO 2-phospho-L-lactate transferase